MEIWMMGFFLNTMAAMIGLLLGVGTGMIQNRWISLVTMLAVCGTIVGFAEYFVASAALDAVYQTRWFFLEAVIFIGMATGRFLYRKLTGMNIVDDK